jgi:hypothetical protein
VLLGYLFDLGLGQRGKIRSLNRDHSGENLPVMGFQILIQDAGRIARSRPMANQDDCLR